MTYYLFEDTLEQVLSLVEEGDLIFCSKDFNKIEELNKYNKKHLPVFKLDGTYPSNLKKDDYKIVFFSKKDDEKIYRRTKFFNLLNNNVKVLKVKEEDFVIENNKEIINETLNKNPLVVFEGNLNYKNILKNISLKNSKIIYDKYDSFSEDEEIQKMANLSIGSSYQIFENELNNSKEKIYIPNGCDVAEYKPVEKYKQKTAIYTGYNLRKVDFNIMTLLKAVNPDWNIKIYGDEKLIEELELKEKYPDLEFCGFLQQDKLVEELSKCHIGLNFIEYDEATKGQLSDKFFNYCNAHIPTLIYEEFQNNYKDYKNLIKVFDFGELELDKYIENLPTDEEYEKVLKDCDWKNRFDKIFETIKEKNLI